MPELPLGVTPIADLDAATDLRHAEVLEVHRDFGQPGVDIALDAWMAADGSDRIESVRLWWSDEVDRYPFSARMRKRIDIDYRRLRPDRVRVTVAGQGRRFAFDVALVEGRPVALAKVKPAGRPPVRDCRVDTAQLHARRVLGIPVGLQSMIVVCSVGDTFYRAPVAG